MTYQGARQCVRALLLERCHALRQRPNRSIAAGSHRTASPPRCPGCAGVVAASAQLRDWRLNGLAKPPPFLQTNRNETFLAGIAQGEPKLDAWRTHGAERGEHDVTIRSESAFAMRIAHAKQPVPGRAPLVRFERSAARRR